MSQLITQTFQQIEALLHDKNFPEALSLLKSLNPSSLKGEEYGYYCILLTEAGLNVGEYFESYIDEAIETFRFSSDAGKFAKAKYLKGWLFSSLGRHHEAKELFIEAYTNYLRGNDLNNAARVLNRLTFVTIHTGNTETAIDNLRKCIDIYNKLGESVIKTKVAHNLAYLYFMCGNLRDSLSTYNAYPVTEQEHGEKPVMNLFNMSAIPHALKGDIATAKKTIAKATPYLEKYPRDKAIYFENLGLILILDGDYAGAEQALKEGLRISLEIAPESALVSQIKRLFGDLYVATKNYDLAEKYATEALEVAEKINERIEIAACWRVLAQVQLAKGNAEEARGLYRKALDLFNQISARYELAVTRYLYATSNLCQTTERIALLYLAREYFESEEVHHYVEKIDAALKAVPIVHRPIRKPSPACPTIIVVNAQMKKLIALAEHVAESEMTVLLTGATGTGKDLLARYIHYYSGRRGEFVAVNAAAVPDSMIESELFGCTKGAFTGSKDRVGLFEQADKGTFYLDEITDATPEFQAKLLHVLETRSIRRLGENTIRKVNFRLIAASNHDLHQRMRDNLFRLDLYHRLNEICIHLPPLDDRKDDISALVHHSLTFAGFRLTDSNELEIQRLGKILSHRTWPGNVRELEHEVKRLWTHAKGDVSRMIELALETGPKSKHELLLELLELHNWNRREVARELGVSEGTIRAWIKKYGLTRQ
jgi:DNA-binding NtrC family response regulator